MYGANAHRMTRSLKYGSLREMRRRSDYAIQEAGKIRVLILEILAQAGGEVTITKGTMRQVLESVHNLGYEMVEGANDNEFKIRLVQGEVEDDGIQSSEAPVDGLPGDERLVDNSPAREVEPSLS